MTTQTQRTKIGDDDVVAHIRGHEQPVVQQSRAELEMKTVESWDMEALTRLEEKVAKQKAELLDAEKLLKDQTILAREAQQLRSTKLANAEKMEKVVNERASERDRWLAEERNLEQRRAETHLKAVEFENLRAEALAQVVLARKEAEASENIHKHHLEGIKQAQALIDAHRLAIEALEKQRVELKRKEVVVDVKHAGIAKPSPVDISVQVKPKVLAEARVEAATAAKEVGAQAHIQETLPQHTKSVVAPKNVGVAAHVEHVKTEKVVVEKK